MSTFHFFMTAVLAVNLLILLLVAWNVLGWPRPSQGKEQTRSHCSVLIPARNESAHIADCLDHVLVQENTICEILVYDDHSSDDTGSIVEAYRKRDARIRLIQPLPLPPGWCGKTFACATLAEQAKGEWLLFIDADARMRAGSVDRMVHEAVARNATFLSCWPGLVLVGFWEKTLLPMLNFVVLTLFPAPLSLKRRDASLGLAHGACILARRREYRRIGGHEAVRDEIFEDTSLARIWRARGEHAVCLDGQDIVGVRMYESFTAVWRGFRKNFFPAFRHRVNFWLFMLLHLTCFLLPFALWIGSAIAGDRPSVLIMLAALCVLAMRAALAWRFRYPFFSVWLHPLAETILLGLGLVSWWSCSTGQGVEWKGRIYRTRGKAERVRP